MKSKGNLLVMAMHGSVLAVFLLLQGCATGDCPIDWLNWPYNSPAEEPLILPADAGYQDNYNYEDIIALPPAFEDEAPITVVDETVYVAPAPVPSASDQIYTVKKGDTLSGIASMYGTSWKKLADYNGMANPNKLIVGQQIAIPGDLKASAPVSRSSTPKSSGSSSTSSYSSSSKSIAQGSSYVIQRGDSLSEISKRSGVSVAEIKAANGLDSNAIVAGKSLTIPRKGQVDLPMYSEPVSKPKPASTSTSSTSGLMSELSTVVDSTPAPAPLADLAVNEDLQPLAQAASAPVYEHVLYPGETLEDVARQYSSSQAEIMELNGIMSIDDVKPGMKLMVPLPE